MIEERWLPRIKWNVSISNAMQSHSTPQSSPAVFGFPLVPTHQANFLFESSFDHFTVSIRHRFLQRPTWFKDPTLPHRSCLWSARPIRSNLLLRSDLLSSFSEVQTILVFPPSVFCYTHQFTSAETTSTNTTTHITLARTSDTGIAQLGNLWFHVSFSRLELVNIKIKIE